MGIRDLDWDYSEKPSDHIGRDEGDGWLLLTLPCKEIENLFCDPEFLHAACERKIPVDELAKMIQEESSDDVLVKDWKYQALHRIRERLGKNLDPSTREQSAEKLFDSWMKDHGLRARLVAGKQLWRRTRKRIAKDHRIRLSERRAFVHLHVLPKSWTEIVDAVFPDLASDGIRADQGNAGATNA